VRIKWGEEGAFGSQNDGVVEVRNVGETIAVTVLFIEHIAEKL